MTNRTLLAVVVVFASVGALGAEDKPGVIAAFEVMIMSPAIENHIRKAETFKIPSTIQTSKNKGMFLLDDHLLELFKQGKISRETTLGRSQDPRSLQQKLDTLGIRARTRDRAASRVSRRPTPT